MSSIIPVLVLVVFVQSHGVSGAVDSNLCKGSFAIVSRTSTFWFPKGTEHLQLLVVLDSLYQHREVLPLCSKALGYPKQHCVCIHHGQVVLCPAVQPPPICIPIERLPLLSQYLVDRPGPSGVDCSLAPCNGIVVPHHVSSVPMNIILGPRHP